MTFQISVAEIQILLLRLAEYIEPASLQYLKLITDNRDLSCYDWLKLSIIFSRITDDSILEESCYLAIKRGIIDVSVFERLVREVEATE